jgi:hypothetical protein
MHHVGAAIYSLVLKDGCGGEMISELCPGIYDSEIRYSVRNLVLRMHQVEADICRSLLRDGSMVF